MTSEEYTEKALRTMVTTDYKDTLIMAALGLCGESGEVADDLKKFFFHHQAMPAKIKDELGDVLWYLTILTNTLGFTLEDIMERNIEKLEARHGTTGFTPGYSSDSTQ